MPDETITPIAPSAQVLRCNHHVETRLTFALCARGVCDNWLLIDAFFAFGLLSHRQAKKPFPKNCGAGTANGGR
jgi:hypothetical protein